MIGLICIGLLGLGTVLFLTRSNQAQQVSAIPDTPTPIPPTFTPTSTPSATPTETPLPTPTSTPVIRTAEAQATETPQGGQPPAETPPTDLNVTPTNTLVLQPTATATANVTPTAVAQIPASGGVLPPNDNSFLMWAGVVLLLLLTLGMAHYLRASPPGH